MRAGAGGRTSMLSGTAGAAAAAEALHRKPGHAAAAPAPPCRLSGAPASACLHTASAWLHPPPCHRGRRRSHPPTAAHGRGQGRRGGAGSGAWEGCQQAQAAQAHAGCSAAARRQSKPTGSSKAPGIRTANRQQGLATGMVAGAATSRTEGKTYLGVSSPAYPALTAHVPMSSTMAFTSSAGGVQAQQVSRAAGGAAQAPAAAAARCWMGGRLAGRSRTSAIHGARHPSRRASAAAARSRRSAVSARPAAGAASGFDGGENAAGSRCGVRESKSGAAWDCSAECAAAGGHGERGTPDRLNCSARQLTGIGQQLPEGLQARLCAKTDRAARTQLCTAALARRRVRPTRRGSRQQRKRCAVALRLPPAARRCRRRLPRPLPASPLLHLSCRHRCTTRRPPCLGSWRARCWRGGRPSGTMQRAWPWQPSWLSCTPRWAAGLLLLLPALLLWLCCFPLTNLSMRLAGWLGPREAGNVASPSGPETATARAVGWTSNGSATAVAPCRCLLAAGLHCVELPQGGAAAGGRTDKQGGRGGLAASPCRSAPGPARPALLPCRDTWPFHRPVR